jgi:hypothetical protein
MANTLTGRVLKIEPTQEFQTKDGTTTFKKREIVLDCSLFDRYTGEKNVNTPLLEFVGSKCDLIDNFRPGDLVDVSFDVQGSSYRSADGKEHIFTRIRPYAIVRRETKKDQSQQQQITPPQQVQQQVSPQQLGYTVYPNQMDRQPQQPQRPQPIPQNDGLPF